MFASGGLIPTSEKVCKFRDKNCGGSFMPAATKIPEKYKDRHFEVTTYGETYRVVLIEKNYGNNNRLRINIVNADDFEPIAVLTMNILDDKPGDDAFFVKTYSENEQISKELFKTGIFEKVDHPREVAWRFKE